ncbi:Dehydrogenase/reductase SDR family protein 7-like [Chionoecetes opilio]|uniref:Dehydrogenase/reductase SDR family protein 7-like n=1 Tax=Chionoecetes opilio TaxID=41210 RepID=A0A8J4Y1L8_CHIOP|nr:Dehydrogenase/reductase SDR family protein 7-like [Chionoecetes opilio]
MSVASVLISVTLAFGPVVGWATLAVMGPLFAARVTYRTLMAIVSRAFSSKRALCGKVVLITGASSGLGEALAHALYRCGVRLILAARNTEKLENIKETLLKAYKCPRFHSHRVVLRFQLLTLNVTTCDLPTLLEAAGDPPSWQHAVIRLTCAFLRKTGQLQRL